MPLVTFACPECQKVLKSAPTVPAGKKIKCPTCGATFPMPAQEAGLATAVSDRPPPARPTRGADAGAPPGQTKGAKRRSRGVLVAAGVAALLLLGGLGAGAWFLLSGGSGGGQEDPLAYVPPGAEFVAGADMPALLDDPLLGPQVEKAIREQVHAGDFLDRCEKETGLTTRELLGHALLAGKLDGPGGAAPPAMPPGVLGMRGVLGGLPRPGPVTLILKTSRPFDPKQLARAATSPVRRTAHGKTYYEVSEGEVRTLYMPSDRIVVLSALPAGELDPLFTSDGTTPSVSADAVALVRGVEANPFWAVVPFEGRTRARLDSPAGKDKPRAEPDALTDALAKAKGVALWAASDGERLKFGAQVACADAAGATQTVQAAEKAWNEQKLKVATLGLGLNMMRLTKTAKASGELTGSLKFTADGTTARATADVSRKALADAAEELQGRQQDGFGPKPGAGPGKSR